MFQLQELSLNIKLLLKPLQSQFKENIQTINKLNTLLNMFHKLDKKLKLIWSHNKELNNTLSISQLKEYKLLLTQLSTNLWSNNLLTPQPLSPLDNKDLNFNHNLSNNLWSNNLWSNRVTFNLNKFLMYNNNNNSNLKFNMFNNNPHKILSQAFKTVETYNDSLYFKIYY